MASKAQTNSCKLLELPAELRNRIYRFTLCNAAPIQFPRNGLEQPALVRTCKQIRSEAVAMYYIDNVFAMPAVRFDHSTAFAFEKQARPHVRTSSLEYGILVGDDDTEYSWSELLKWLQAYHEGKTKLWGSADEPTSGAYYVAAKAFEMVRKMKGDDWSKVEDLLQTFKEGTMAIVSWAE